MKYVLFKTNKLALSYYFGEGVLFKLLRYSISIFSCSTRLLRTETNN